ALVRRRWRGNVVPRVRVSTTGPPHGRLRDDSPIQCPVRTGAPGEPKRHGLGHPEHCRLGRPAGLCLYAYGRPVAIHWAAFRVELHAAPVRSELERVYNGGYGLRAPLESPRFMERRRLWP